MGDRLQVTQKDFEKIKKSLELNKGFHSWNFEKVMLYLMYFLPETTAITKPEVSRLLSDLDLQSNDASFFLDRNSRNNGKFLCSSTTRNHYTISTYRFEKGSREAFEKEKKAAGELRLLDEHPEPETVQVSQSVQKSISEISNDDERHFAEETLKCLQVEAFRAAIVMGWNLAFYHLRNWIFCHKLEAFNAVLITKRKSKRSEIKYDAIEGLDDFYAHRESFIIETCKEAKLIDKHESEILAAGLKERNRHAHPNSVKTDSAIAAGHVSKLIREIVNNEKFQ